MPDDKRVSMKRHAPQSTWWSNALRSVGSSGLNLIQEMAPYTSGTVSSFQKTAADVRNTIRKSSTSGKIGLKAFENSELIKGAREGLRNAKEDLKSGNIAGSNREARTGAIAEMSAEMDEAFSDVSFGSLDEGGGDDYNTTINNFNGDNAQIANTMVEGFTKTANATIAAGNAQVNAVVAASSNSMMANQRFFTDITSKLDSVDKNIAAIVEYLNTNVTKLIEANIAHYGQQDEKKSEEDDSHTKIFGNGAGFNLQEYGKLVKSQLNDNLGGAFEMYEMIKQMGGVRAVLSNPLSLILPNIISKQTKKAFKEFDKSFRDFLPVVAERLAELGDDPDSGKIEQFIGKTLGIKTQINAKISRKSYSNAVTQWDLEAKNSLTRVIPGYLSEILKTVRGDKERERWDNRSMSFRKESDIQKSYINEIHQAISSAFSDSDLATSINEIRRDLEAQSPKTAEQFEELANRLYVGMATRNKRVTGQEIANSNNKFVRNLLSGGDSAKIDELTSLYGEKLIELLEDVVTRTGDSLSASASVIRARTAANRHIDQMNKNASGEYNQDTLDAIAKLINDNPNGIAGTLNAAYTQSNGRPVPAALAVTRSQIKEERERKDRENIYRNIDDIRFLLNRGINVKLAGYGTYGSDTSPDAFRNATLGNAPVGPMGSASDNDKAVADYKSAQSSTGSTAEEISQGIEGKVRSGLNKASSFMQTLITDGPEDAARLITGTLKSGVIGALNFTKNHVFSPIADVFLGEKDGSGKRKGGVVHTITDSVGEYLFGKSKNGEEGFVNRIKSKINEGVDGWSIALFGDDVEEGETPDDAAKRRRKKFQGLIGKVGLGAVGGSLVSGLFGSSLFGILADAAAPGLGALVGMGTAIALNTKSFKRVLFGEEEVDENGNKTGKYLRGIISRKTQEFFKNNKKTIIGGAAVGLLKSFIMPSGGGLLAGIVGGPMAGMLLGAGLGIVKETQWFKTLMFGKTVKDSEGNIISHTDGLKDKIGRFFSKSGGKKGSGGGGYKAGMTLLSTMGGIGIGGLIGTALSPAIGGLLGATVGIVANSDKLKTAIFGEMDEKSGKRKGGIMGRIGTRIEESIINPIKYSAEELKIKLSAEAKKIGAKFGVFLSPLKTAFTDFKDRLSERITNTFHNIERGLNNVIIKPIAGIFKTLTAPVRALGGAILDVGKKAVTAPFRMLSGALGNAAKMLDLKNKKNIVKQYLKNAVGETFGLIKSSIVNGINSFWPVKMIRTKLFDKKTGLISRLSNKIVDVANERFKTHFDSIGDMLKAGFKNALALPFKMIGGIFKLAFKGIGLVGKGAGAVLNAGISGIGLGASALADSARKNREKSRDKAQGDLDRYKELQAKRDSGEQLSESETAEYYRLSKKGGMSANNIRDLESYRKTNHNPEDIKRLEWLEKHKATLSEDELEELKNRKKSIAKENSLTEKQRRIASRLQFEVDSQNDALNNLNASLRTNEEGEKESLMQGFKRRVAESKKGGHSTFGSIFRELVNPGWIRQDKLDEENTLYKEHEGMVNDLKRLDELNSLGVLTEEQQAEFNKFKDIYGGNTYDEIKEHINKRRKSYQDAHAVKGVAGQIDLIDETVNAERDAKLEDLAKKRRDNKLRQRLRREAGNDEELYKSKLLEHGIEDNKYDNSLEETNAEIADSVEELTSYFQRAPELIDAGLREGSIYTHDVHIEKTFNETVAPLLTGIRDGIVSIAEKIGLIPTPATAGAPMELMSSDSSGDAVMTPPAKSSGTKKPKKPGRKKKKNLQKNARRSNQANNPVTAITGGADVPDESPEGDATFNVAPAEDPITQEEITNAMMAVEQEDDRDAAEAKAEAERQEDIRSAQELDEKNDAAKIKAAENAVEEERHRSLLSVLKGSLAEARSHNSAWNAIFSKNGLITMGILAAVPLISKIVSGDFFKGIIDFIGGAIGGLKDLLTNIGSSIFNALGGTGGILGIIKNIGDLGDRADALLSGNVIGAITNEHGDVDNLGTSMTRTAARSVTKVAGGETASVFLQSASRAANEAAFDAAVEAGDDVAAEAFMNASIRASDNLDDLYNLPKKTGKTSMVSKIANKLSGGRIELKPKQTLGAKVVNKLSGGKLMTEGGIVDNLAQMIKSAIKSLSEKLGTAFGKKASGCSFMRKLITTASDSFLGKAITSALPKFGKVLAKMGIATGSMGFAELAFIGMGALDGVARVGYIFDCAPEDVDYLMTNISAIFSGLLASSAGGVFDIFNSLVESICGWNPVKCIAQEVYKIMATDQMEEKLKQAQGEFRNDWKVAAYDEYVKTSTDEVKMSQEEFLKMSDADIANKSGLQFEDYNNKVNAGLVDQAVKGLSDFGQRTGDKFANTWGNVNNFGEGVGAVFKTVGHVGSTVTDFGNTLAQGGSKLLSYAGDLGDAAVTGVGAGIGQGIGSLFGNAEGGRALGESIGTSVGSVVESATVIGEAALEGIGGLGSWLGDTADGFIGGVADVFTGKKSLDQALADAGTYMADSWTGMCNWFGEQGEKLTNIWSDVGESWSNTWNELFMSEEERARKKKEEAERKAAEEEAARLAYIEAQKRTMQLYAENASDAALSWMDTNITEVHTLASGGMVASNKPILSMLSPGEIVYNPADKETQKKQSKAEKDAVRKMIRSNAMTDDGIVPIPGVTKDTFFLSAILSAITKQNLIDTNENTVTRAVQKYVSDNSTSSKIADDEIVEYKGSDDRVSKRVTKDEANTLRIIDAINGLKKSLTGAITPAPVKEESGYGRGEATQDVKMYNQEDPQWSKGNRKVLDIFSSGCGPTAAAIAASAYGSDVDPVQAAAIINASGNRVSDGGTKPRGIEAVGAATGVPMSEGATNESHVINNLIDGRPVIFMGKDNYNAGRGDGVYGDGMHYVVGTGYDPASGSMEVVDPLKKGKQRHSLRSVLKNAASTIYTGKGRRGRKSNKHNKYGRGLFRKDFSSTDEFDVGLNPISFGADSYNSAWSGDTISYYGGEPTIKDIIDAGLYSATNTDLNSDDFIQWAKDSGHSDVDKLGSLADSQVSNWFGKDIGVFNTMWNTETEQAYRRNVIDNLATGDLGKTKMRKYYDESEEWLGLSDEEREYLKSYRITDKLSTNQFRTLDHQLFVVDAYLDSFMKNRPQLSLDQKLVAANHWRYYTLLRGDPNPSRNLIITSFDKVYANSKRDSTPWVSIPNVDAGYATYDEAVAKGSSIPNTSGMSRTFLPYFSWQDNHAAWGSTAFSYSDALVHIPKHPSIPMDIDLDIAQNGNVDNFKLAMKMLHHMTPIAAEGVATEYEQLSDDNRALYFERLVNEAAYGSKDGDGAGHKWKCGSSRELLPPTSLPMTYQLSYTAEVSNVLGGTGDGGGEAVPVGLIAPIFCAIRYLTTPAKDSEYKNKAWSRIKEIAPGDSRTFQNDILANSEYDIGTFLTHIFSGLGDNGAIRDHMINYFYCEPFYGYWPVIVDHVALVDKFIENNIIKVNDNSMKVQINQDKKELRDVFYKWYNDGVITSLSGAPIYGSFQNPARIRDFFMIVLDHHNEGYFKIDKSSYPAAEIDLTSRLINNNRVKGLGAAINKWLETAYKILFESENVSSLEATKVETIKAIGNVYQLDVVKAAISKIGKLSYAAPDSNQALLIDSGKSSNAGFVIWSLNHSIKLNAKTIVDLYNKNKGGFISGTKPIDITTISDLSGSLLAGDVLFYGNSSEYATAGVMPTHVEIYIGDGYTISHYDGVKGAEIHKLSPHLGSKHTLLYIKRYIANEEDDLHSMEIRVSDGAYAIDGSLEDGATVSNSFLSKMMGVFGEIGNRITSGAFTGEYDSDFSDHFSNSSGSAVKLPSDDPSHKSTVSYYKKDDNILSDTASTLTGTLGNSGDATMAGSGRGWKRRANKSSGEYGRGRKRKSYGRGNEYTSDGETVVLPSGAGTFRSYMTWDKITNPTTNQYNLRVNSGENYDDLGYARVRDENGTERYVVATTQTFGKAGDYIDVYQGDGTMLPAVIGDIKSWTNDNELVNKWGHREGDCVLEFIKQAGGPSIGTNPGTDTDHPEWKNLTVTKIVNRGSSKHVGGNGLVPSNGKLSRMSYSISGHGGTPSNGKTVSDKIEGYNLVTTDGDGTSKNPFEILQNTLNNLTTGVESILFGDGEVSLEPILGTSSSRTITGKSATYTSSNKSSAKRVGNLGDNSIAAFKKSNLNNEFTADGWFMSKKGISSGSTRSSSYSGHKGIDYGAPEGATIYSPVDGEVVKRVDGPDGSHIEGNVYTMDAWDDYGGFGIKKWVHPSGFGNYTVVRDNEYGMYHIFAHQNVPNTSLAVGSKIRRGDKIGTVGTTGLSTGNHLHYQISPDNGKGGYNSSKYMDPNEFDYAIYSGASGRGALHENNIRRSKPYTVYDKDPKGGGIDPDTGRIISLLEKMIDRISDVVTNTGDSVTGLDKVKKAMEDIKIENTTNVVTPGGVQSIPHQSSASKSSSTESYARKIARGHA